MTMAGWGRGRGGAEGRLMLLQLAVPGMGPRVESAREWAEFRGGYDPCSDPRLPPSALDALSAGLARPPPHGHLRGLPRIAPRTLYLTLSTLSAPSTSLHPLGPATACA